MNEIIKTFGVFLVVAVVACGLVLPQSASAALPAPNFMPGFPMVAGPQIIIMWTPVPGAVKYHVYLNGDKIAESVSMQYMTLAPADGGQYKYQVSAVDATGVEGPLSSEGKVSIIILKPPRDIQYMAREDRIILRWDSAPGAVIYDLYRRKKGENEFLLLTSMTNLRYEDAQLEDGVVYEYAVKAKDISGKSSEFSPVTEAALFVADAADTGEETAKTYAMALLPAENLSQIQVPNYARFLTTDGEQMAVSDDSLWLFPAVSTLIESRVVMQEVEDEEGNITTYRVFPTVPKRRLAKGQIGFTGVAFSRDGSRLYACQGNKSLVWVFNTDDWSVEAKWSVPKPPVAPVGTFGTLWMLRDTREVNIKSSPKLFEIGEGPDGTVYVTDPKNSRVVFFANDGEFLGTFGYIEGEGVIPQPNWLIDKASYLSVGEDRLFVSSLNSVEGFDFDGNRLPVIGGIGQTFGLFQGSNGSTVDSDGRLWVTDMKANTIQGFAATGEEEEWRPIYALSTPDKKGNIKTPTPVGVAVTPDNQYLFVAEIMNKTVGVFKLIWDDADPISE